MKEKLSYRLLSHTILLLVTLAMILPMVLLFLSSVTDENVLINNGYSFFPAKFSLGAYQYIINYSEMIMRAYQTTILATFLGTTISIAITAMMSFAISNKGLPGRKLITFFIFFTMLFNGGLVPSYIMWTNFKVVDTIWAYVLPFLLTNGFSIILIRSYFEANVPMEMYESAKIDGAGYFRIFWKIALPLGKPILITIGLFTCLAYWNDWLNGMYFINAPRLYSIQVLLNKMSANIQATLTYANYNINASDAVSVPQTSIRMAIAMIAVLPILVVYPFLQKYFAEGIMLGAVKG